LIKPRPKVGEVPEQQFVDVISGLLDNAQASPNFALFFDQPSDRKRNQVIM
jgi:hypothetical protein